MAFNEMLQPKSVALFFVARYEARCSILNKSASKSVASTKSTFRSPLHPYGTTPVVFKSSACEGEFNLINVNDCFWYIPNLPQ